MTVPSKIVITRCATITDAHLLAAQLELRGIECEIPDEYAFDTAPYLANNINPVRIVIKRADAEPAKEVLIELGKWTDDQQKQLNIQELAITKQLGKVPIIGKLSPFSRLSVTVLILLVAVLTTTYLITRETTADKIMTNSWCIQSFKHNGKKIYRTLENENLVYIPGYCSNRLSFSNDDIPVPGFGGKDGYGYCIIKNDKLTIYPSTKNIVKGMETNFLFDSYVYEIDDNVLILKSESTTIQLQRLEQNDLNFYSE